MHCSALICREECGRRNLLRRPLLHTVSVTGLPRRLGMSINAATPTAEGWLT